MILLLFNRSIWVTCPVLLIFVEQQIGTEAVFIRLLRKISKLKCDFQLHISNYFQLYFNKTFHAYEKIVVFHKHEQIHCSFVGKNGEICI